jgi:gentisate 1,2-dioxygenase
MARASHYQTQKKRRKEFIEEWRKHRHTVVAGEEAVEVKVADPVPGQRTLGLMGEAAGRPTRFLDAHRHQLPAGAVTSACSHSWDAVVFVVHGAGTAMIGADRFEFKPWDAFHTPSFVPYRLEVVALTELLVFSSYPIVGQLGAARVWAGGDLSVSSVAGPLLPRHLAEKLADTSAGRVFTDYDEIELRPNPKGTRSKFLVDPSLGYRTSGLTMVMTQYPPAGGQAMHRHPGEAFLYVVEGEGETYIGYEPEGGSWHPWKTGDLVIVDHFVWHQHWNTNSTSPARLLRVHMHETILASMQAVLDPIQLLIEPEQMLRQMPDPSGIAWPDDRRPGVDVRDA